jgi:cytochrome c biogenesis protein CcmG, thiol:disulfide interchange protein DsbE
MLLVGLTVGAAFAQCADAQSANTQNSPSGTQSGTPGAKSATPPKRSPEQELQLTIEAAGSDRAALVRNLEAYLKKYPDAQSRPQIYRALVEADLQIQDTAHATEYAERLVALSPEDMSITLLAIQLLERNGDEAALKRAENYATRVLEFIARSSPDDRSPRVSLKEWQAEHQRDQMSVLLLRGRLAMKLKDSAGAEKDLSASYAIQPGAASAEKLGEIAEMKKDSAAAIQQYAKAFALADTGKASPGRREIREKLGNVWRLAQGSDAGLGEYLLQAFDEVSQEEMQQAAGASAVKRNAGAKTAYDFTLRKAGDGAPFSLLPLKGKVLVVNFWATWCGPCRALAPLFERVSLEFRGDAGVLFFGANCDEDESLVAPFLATEPPKISMYFADGLDRLLGITSFPTVVVLDRDGKIVYRSEGFGDDDFEKHLAEAIHQAIVGSPAAASLSGSRR